MSRLLRDGWRPHSGDARAENELEAAIARGEAADCAKRAAAAPRCRRCRNRLTGTELRRVPVLPTCDRCTRAAQPDLRGALAEFHATRGVDGEKP